MKRSVIAIAAATALLVATAGCGSNSGKKSQTAGGLDKVSVNSLEILSLAPMMVADSKGFFKKHKIDVSFSDADIYSRLAVQSQGKLDVNIPGVGGAFFNAVNQGLHVRAVADRQQYRCASDNLLLARSKGADASIKSLRDLRG